MGTGVHRTTQWRCADCLPLHKWLAVELAQTVVDAQAVPSLVLCIQEPELTLKRIAAWALSDIPWGKNGQGSAQGKARFVLYEAAPAAAAVAAGVAAGPSASALCLRRHLFFVQYIRMTRNNVYGKLKVYLVNPRARHAVWGAVKLASPL